MKKKLARPVKGTSWPDLVLQVELQSKEDKGTDRDKGKPFPIENASSIRPAISGRVKLLYPDREYEANKEVFQGELVLMVRRYK